MNADRLRMTTQFGSDLVGCFARPTLQRHLRMEFPISWCVMTPGQLAHLAFFLRISCRSRFHLLRHLAVPPCSLFSLILSSTRNAAIGYIGFGSHLVIQLVHSYKEALGNRFGIRGTF